MVTTPSSYIQYFNVEKNTAYEALKNACDVLFSRQFSYQERNKHGNIENVKSRWVSEIRYIDKEASVKLIFAPSVVPLITRLEQHFTSYEIEQVRYLSSRYAIRLYEILIQWRSIGKTPIFEINNFREKLGLATDDHPRIDNFKRKVLDFSVSQINKHTDILVGYEQVKAGRVITGFTFTFTQKKPPTDITPKPRKTEPKPKSIKKEEQLDWMTSDILDRFISLSQSQQQTILDRVEQTLKGATRARFKVARMGNTKQLVTEFSLDINDALMRSAK